MTVISVVPDQQAHTLTLTAQYAAPVEDVWQLWADPRQLERWCGYERDTAERGRRGCGAGQRSMGRLLIARWRSAAVGKA